jgi:hypothetical protein
MAHRRRASQPSKGWINEMMPRITAYASTPTQNIAHSSVLNEFCLPRVTAYRVDIEASLQQRFVEAIKGGSTAARYPGR